MTTFKTGIAIAMLALAIPMASISSSNALPISSAGFAAGPATVNPVSKDTLTQVRYGGWHGGGFRGGFRGRGLGIGAGLLIGSAIGAAAANPYYYGPGYGYGYGPGYAYDEAPAYYDGGPVYEGGDGAAYCAQRYRSYNPATGTFRGYDGLDHPCP